MLSGKTKSPDMVTAKDLYLSVTAPLPVFFQPWWIEAVHQGSWNLAVLQKQDKVLAVWPYTLERKALFTIIRNPLLTPYFGPLWLSEEQAAPGWADQLRQQLPKADFLQCSTLPGVCDSLFSEEHYIVHRKKRTFYIDLSQTLETIWSDIHPKRKNDIRKAQEDLQVSSGFMDIHEFTAWHSRSFTGKGKQYPYSVPFLQKLVDTTAAQHASKAYTARDKKGHIAGQVWMVYDKDTMYYLLSATPEQAHRGAISLLIWEAIQEARKSDLRRFDFEGSMDEGIAFYFRRFGGSETPYNEYSITNSLLWKLKQKILG
ncbi:MAG TPA: GNAT family N-acetyltransferase [Chitinophagaceae bacterium]|nr:GNAT family N-acetyltransferase [Chitinophagaceae bacterium]